MLNDYRIKSVSDIYYEDLLYILHPEWAWRELQPFNPQKRNRHPSNSTPDIIKYYIHPHYHLSESQGWNDFLSDIKNGRIVLIRDLFWGEEILGVMA